MRVLDGEPIFSASDLVGFAACAHLTQLELAAARGEIRRPNRDDPLLDIMVRRGEAHEAALLEHEAESGRDVVTVSADTTDRAGLVAAARDTEAAMRAGAPVIYQAAFLHDGWVGHADFVERVDDVASDFGSWSYEVADAKLTRTVRASALLQLCEYSAHVARLQGRAPDRIHVITGDEVRHSFRLADYAAYHRTLKAEFLATAGVAASAAATTYPEPVEHCSICRWWGVCRDRRRADDHLSLVAGVRGEQRRRMHTVGIDTRAELAHEVTMPAGLSMSPAAFATLHAQAALQVRGDGCEPPLVELIEPAAPEPGVPPQGLAILPAASTGDLFLDLEGDPYAADGGLEYLFGLVDITHGAPEYHAFWGHTKGEERVAFEAAVDLIVEYRRRWPDMHVYHYAPHEPSAFKRLMGEHGTREEEIDDLLRGNVFVDLYRAVRQGVRLSVESYSLKTVETLYFERPDGAVMTAGSSIVTYERYLETGDGALLDEIAAYNRDDCESLIGLREWLEAAGAARGRSRGRRRQRACRTGAPLARRRTRGTDRARPRGAGALPARAPARVAPPRSEAGVVALLRTRQRVRTRRLRARQRVHRRPGIRRRRRHGEALSCAPIPLRGPGSQVPHRPRAARPRHAEVGGHDHGDRRRLRRPQTRPAQHQGATARLDARPAVLHHRAA
jgi:uncharacterized protein